MITGIPWRLPVFDGNVKIMTRFNKRNRYYIFLLLSLIWMGVIFYFSHQIADESQKLSDGILYRIKNILTFIFPNADDDFLSFVVRKSAHAFEYFLLSILLFLTNREVVRSKHRDVMRSMFYIRLYIFPWLYATLYAVTDEIHQYFIPGRSCELRDICMDSGGAVIGTLFMVLCGRIAYNRILKRTTLS